MARFTAAAGGRVQVIGDDYLVTNAALVQRAAQERACNAVLIKPNQAGTITETKAALDAGQRAGFGTIVSARSGETEDVTIVHLAHRLGCRSAEGRILRALGAHGQVERGAAHRGGAGAQPRCFAGCQRSARYAQAPRVG